MNKSVANIFSHYSKSFPDETASSFQSFIASDTDILSRKNFAGHITGSVVWVNRRDEVLLIENPKFLGLLVFPGGHIEPSDSSIEDGAVRELKEELGIREFSGDRVMDVGVPLDINIHWVPENLKKGEPEHQHFDFRFAFVCEKFPSFTYDVEEVQNVILMGLEDLRRLPPHARLAGKMKQALLHMTSKRLRSKYTNGMAQVPNKSSEARG